MNIFKHTVYLSILIFTHNTKSNEDEINYFPDPYSFKTNIIARSFGNTEEYRYGYLDKALQQQIEIEKKDENINELLKKLSIAKEQKDDKKQKTRIKGMTEYPELQYKITRERETLTKMRDLFDIEIHKKSKCPEYIQENHIEENKGNKSGSTAKKTTNGESDETKPMIKEKSCFSKLKKKYKYEKKMITGGALFPIMANITGHNKCSQCDEKMEEKFKLISISYKLKADVDYNFNSDQYIQKLSKFDSDGEFSLDDILATDENVHFEINKQSCLSCWLKKYGHYKKEHYYIDGKITQIDPAFKHFMRRLDALNIKSVTEQPETSRKTISEDCSEPEKLETTQEDFELKPIQTEEQDTSSDDISETGL